MSEAWMQRAACRGLDPAMFFPTTGEPTGPARRVCLTCPVRAECLELVLSLDGHVGGVWADTTDRDRRVIRRMRAAA